MSAIGCIKQGFRTRGNIALAVKQQVANFLTELGPSGLKGSHNFAPLGTQELFEKV
jgi:hypothetical protein